ncbi:MAG: hypothetical protein CM1200mP29_05580 [Verrucomicrobiota bacterium]|nr:MAG: hypothetical protein CM1200mP29_05580 [Verrucomicrobiota bacterium]
MDQPITAHNDWWSNRRTCYSKLGTIFKKTWAPFTVPIYAILRDFFLAEFPDFSKIVFPVLPARQSFPTLGILGALLLAYKSKIIKPTENFKLGIAAATGGKFFLST